MTAKQLKAHEAITSNRPEEAGHGLARYNQLCKIDLNTALEAAEQIMKRPFTRDLKQEHVTFEPTHAMGSLANATNK
ncbi:hypothetical protein P8452_77466 [Trifolium repens]|jgi:hypothetical protein|nr:hypothetical protein P8452_77466 [Trifolium repens]